MEKVQRPKNLRTHKEDGYVLTLAQGEKGEVKRF